MKIVKTPIEGLLVLQPNVFEDERGYFLESWNEKRFKDMGLDLDFVQDNLSLSHKGVLRGLHFQNPPFSQGKLVRVIKGRALDVAVDIRKDSLTYGEHFSIELSEENKTIFWLPAGFAHGFVALVDDTIFSYKCTNFYNRQSEETLLWCDEDLQIDWRIKSPIVSDKDKNAPYFSSLLSQF